METPTILEISDSEDDDAALFSALEQKLTTLQASLEAQFHTHRTELDQLRTRLHDDYQARRMEIDAITRWAAAENGIRIGKARMLKKQRERLRMTQGRSEDSKQGRPEDSKEWMGQIPLPLPPTPQPPTPRILDRTLGSKRSLSKRSFSTISDGDDRDTGPENNSAKRPPSRRLKKKTDTQSPPSLPDSTGKPPSEFTLSPTSLAPLQACISTLPNPTATPPPHPLLFQDTLIRGKIGGNIGRQSIVKIGKVSQEKQVGALKCPQYISLYPYHHYMPPLPGKHGVMLDYAGVEAADVDPAIIFPLFKFMRITDDLNVDTGYPSNPGGSESPCGPGGWLYCGEYVIYQHIPVPTEVWKSFPLSMRRHWVKGLKERGWGQDLIREKGLIGPDPGDASSLTNDDVLGFFDKGDLGLTCCILQCVGYEMERYKALEALVAREDTQVPSPTKETTPVKKSPLRSRRGGGVRPSRGGRGMRVMPPGGGFTSSQKFPSSQPKTLPPPQRAPRGMPKDAPRINIAEEVKNGARASRRKSVEGQYTEPALEDSEEEEEDAEDSDSDASMPPVKGDGAARSQRSSNHHGHDGSEAMLQLSAAQQDTL
ncbi:hypothetical protein DFH27DRAFT_653728 [Peziza echinospora]|nr:hypothetical protein DFH27DRAFT_653728 [Peziza echinospora]